MDEHRKGRDGWRLPSQQLETLVEAALMLRLQDAAKLAADLDRLIEPHALARLPEAVGKLAATLQNDTLERRQGVITRLVHRIELRPAELTIQLDRVSLCTLLTGAAPNLTGDAGQVISV